jgi:hypothetical protein
MNSSLLSILEISQLFFKKSIPYFHLLFVGKALKKILSLDITYLSYFLFCWLWL